MSEKEKDALVTENQNLKDEIKKLKTPFIDSIVDDSRGHIKRETIENLNIEGLKLLRRIFDSTVQRDYQDFCDYREQKQQKAIHTLGTVGTYNQDNKTFENGV